MLKRSQYLIAGVGMFLAVVILSGFLAAGDLPSGTMFLGDARHSGGETAGDLTIMPTLAWRFATQGPVRSTPAVFDGVVYVGSSDGYLYAVDGRDGHRIWSFAAGAPVNASPVVTSGRVFCAARDGRFFALDRTSGRLLWETPTGGLARYSGGWDYYTSSPLLTTAGICVGGGDGRVYMINPDTGKVTWSFETGGPVRSSPAEADGVVFAGSFDGTLYAIDETTGRLRWKFKCAGNKYFPKGEIQSSPVIWENLVLFGSRDYHIYALDRKTGQLRWKLQHKNSWVIGSPVVRDGVLYVGSSDGLFFQAVDSLRGVEKWRRQTESNVFSSALVAGDVVCFGCWDGDLYALKTATGDVAWRFPTGDAIMSTPVMAGGRIYVGSDDGGVYALQARTGPADSAPARAVFWDESISYNWFAGHKEVRDYLAGCGYEVLDSAALVRFLRARVADHRPSVVVFAMDNPPASISAGADGPPLIRRYLDAGGKVLWLGVAPFALKIDPNTHKPSGIDFTAARKVLDVDQTGSLFDTYGTSATAAGRRWGLPTWWVASWTVDPAAVSTVLSLDETGRAAAWVKAYGGPDGTGFVRIWGRKRVPPDLEVVRSVAEFGLH